MVQEDGKDIWDLKGLREIRQRPDILSRLRFDVPPCMVMEQRFDAGSG